MIDHPKLHWVYFVQKLRTPLLDTLVKSLNFFDRQEFFFILIPIIWLCYRWQLGRKIFYLFCMSNLVNLGLKAFFAKPRPFWIDPSVEVLHVPGYSFPSGAAQSAVLIAGLILYYWKTPWKFVLAPLYFLSLSFSRVYLGVHFPIDLLGGWVVGLLLWGIYLFLFPLAGKFEKAKGPLPIFLLSQCLFFVLIFTFPTKPMTMLMASASGIECGIFLNALLKIYAPPPRGKLEFIFRALLGPAGIFLLYFSLAKLPFFTSPVGTFFLFFFAGIWISALANALCWKCAKIGKDKQNLCK